MSEQTIDSATNSKPTSEAATKPARKGTKKTKATKKMGSKGGVYRRCSIADDLSSVPKATSGVCR